MAIRDPLKYADSIGVSMFVSGGIQTWLKKLYHESLKLAGPLGQARSVRSMFEGLQGMSLASAVDVSMRSMFQHSWCFFVFLDNFFFWSNNFLVKKNFFGQKNFLGGFDEKKLVKKFFWSKFFFGCACMRTRTHARTHSRTHGHTCVRTQASFQDEL